tara:strand:- start:461 stop:682 length:222 start_codon:yes stop_codon:yes gene_type:complete
MNKQQLTPFEQAEYNRKQGMKRFAGILVVQAWIERLRELQAANIPMSVEERKQWHALITQAASAQIQHFGFDA